jgi:5-methylcytosine-specific restriction endonuclease McrA
VLGNPEAKDRIPCATHAACPLCVRKKFGKGSGGKKPKWMLELLGLPCHYCGKPSTTVDHKEPRCRGGKSNRANIVPCCVPCNRLKSDMSYLQFVEIMRKKREGK